MNIFRKFRAQKDEKSTPEPYHPPAAAVQPNHSLQQSDEMSMFVGMDTHDGGSMEMPAGGMQPSAFVETHHSGQLHDRTVVESAATKYVFTI